MAFIMLKYPIKLININLVDEIYLAFYRLAF